MTPPAAISRLRLIALLLIGGCTAHGGWHDGPAPDRPLAQPDDVPAEHRPPPGKCRLWFADRPPDYQPPPGECYELAHKVPLGAMLVESVADSDW